MSRTTLVGLGVVAVAVIGVGAWVLLGGGGADDPNTVRVGDCVQLPDAGAITQIEHRSCTEPHEAEIFHIVDFPAQADYPSEAELETFFGETCLDEPFEAYTGVSFDDAPDLDISYLPPTESAWTAGRRTFVCYLYPAGGGEIDVSHRRG